MQQSLPGCGSSKKPWTAEEDDRLKLLVAHFGPKKWSTIAEQMHTPRVGKQCRERWHNHLSGGVVKSAWTPEEDRVIFQAHEKLVSQTLICLPVYRICRKLAPLSGTQLLICVCTLLCLFFSSSFVAFQKVFSFSSNHLLNFECRVTSGLR